MSKSTTTGLFGGLIGLLMILAAIWLPGSDEDTRVIATRWVFGVIGGFACWFSFMIVIAGLPPGMNDD